MKRLYLILFFSSLAFIAAIAQTKPTKSKKSAYYNAQNKKENTFLNKQWWLGFKAGTNLTKAVVTRYYSVLSPANYDQKLIRKDYDDFNKTGSQGTIEITFFIRGISISLLPTLKHSRFVYTTQYRWADTENA